MMLHTVEEWSKTLLKSAGITIKSVESLETELMSFLDEFASCFARSEGRENFALIIKGLLSDLERKNIERIVLRYGEIYQVRSLQNFMSSENAVDHEALLRLYQEKLAAVISQADGMFTVDGSDIAKKGTKSVGVSRQHCGSRGKIDNCQAAVFVGFTSDIGYGLVAFMLYLPDSWMGEENKDRRDACHVPENVKFKTKIELASEMINNAVRTEFFQAKWVGVDSAFGRSKEFLRNLPDGMLYFADILFNMKVFPMEQSGKNGIAARKSIPVSEVADDKRIPWKRVILGEGSKGPIIAREKCIRIFDYYTKNGKGKGKPGEELWLYIRKYADGKLKYALSNAPADTPTRELRRVATMRWPIEQCFEECKDKLGMDHYEIRSWTGWHRHMLFVFIAHLFLLKMRLRFKDKNPILTLSQARTLVSASIEKSKEAICNAIKCVDYSIWRNWKAYTSHRKKRVSEWDALCDPCERITSHSNC